jgi:hypothetical protein
MSLSSPPVGPQSADFDHEAGESVLHHAPAIFNRASLHVNIGKRLIKTPKLYFYDTGLLCYLLGIRSPGQLELHPLRGAIFESWVASEILKVYANRGETPLMFFYRDRSGTEVDFVIDRGSKILTVEVKAGRTPSPGISQRWNNCGKTWSPRGQISQSRFRRLSCTAARKVRSETRGSCFRGTAWMRFRGPGTDSWNQMLSCSAADDAFGFHFRRDPSGFHRTFEHGGDGG